MKKLLSVFSLWLCALCLTQPAFGEPTGPARQLIDALKMEPIPQEGAWFALTYHSADALDAKNLPARYHGGDRLAGSAIYALETTHDFSALHKLQTDEIWHFYGGDPIEMLLLYPDGHGEVVMIGPDVLHGQHPQFVVPRGVWQGSRPLGDGPDAYAFFGDTLAPGFDPRDFEIGYRDELQQQYPKFADHIARLTRAEFTTRPAEAAGNSSAAIPAARSPEVFQQDAVAPTTVSPGLLLRALVGRVAQAKDDDCSVAFFTVEAGHTTDTSHNKASTEVFLVTRGSGQVRLGDQSRPVVTGSVAVIRPGVRHSLQADAASNLEFYAITTPAFSPEDYVVDPAK